MAPEIAKQKCARCHRPFTPKKEGQIYGPKCEKKIAALQTIESVTKIALAAVIG